MSDIQDMPNQRPNFIGAGLASLAQFFSDSRVDQAKMQILADRLQRRGIGMHDMKKLVTMAMEECDRFPSLAWMLKVTAKRRSDDIGWNKMGPHCTPELDARLTPDRRRFLAHRNADMWKIRHQLSAGSENTELMQKWRVYVDHNRYLRQAPDGDLVRTQFITEGDVAAEENRVR